jgi:Fur family ferric uptake transcriptional regulator
MSGHYELLRRLREQGHRLTPQREMVILALHEADGHLSAEEVYQRVQHQNLYVDVSTVYRTLELLRDMGIVSQCQVNGPQALYELRVRSPHHHLVCRRCKKVGDIASSDLDGLRNLLEERYGFKADLGHLILEGLCSDCARQAAPEATSAAKASQPSEGHEKEEAYAYP